LYSVNGTKITASDELNMPVAFVRRITSHLRPTLPTTTYDLALS